MIDKTDKTEETDKSDYKIAVIITNKEEVGHVIETKREIEGEIAKNLMKIMIL